MVWDKEIWHCSNCEFSSSNFYRVQTHEAYCNLKEPKGIPVSLPKIDVLQRSFDFHPRKTLKLKVKDGTLISDALTNAKEFLDTSTEYSRIEFRFGKYYYVVARLKEDDSTN
jgi:hypothetical protein